MTREDLQKSLKPCQLWGWTKDSPTQVGVDVLEVEEDVHSQSTWKYVPEVEEDVHTSAWSR